MATPPDPCNYPDVGAYNAALQSYYAVTGKMPVKYINATDQATYNKAKEKFCTYWTGQGEQSAIQPSSDLGTPEGPTESNRAVNASDVQGQEGRKKGILGSRYPGNPCTYQDLTAYNMAVDEYMKNPITAYGKTWNLSRMSQDEWDSACGVQRASGGVDVLPGPVPEAPAASSSSRPTPYTGSARRTDTELPVGMNLQPLEPRGLSAPVLTSKPAAPTGYGITAVRPPLFRPGTSLGVPKPLPIIRRECKNGSCSTKRK